MSAEVIKAVPPDVVIAVLKKAFAIFLEKMRSVKDPGETTLITKLRGDRSIAEFYLKTASDEVADRAIDRLFDYASTTPTGTNHEFDEVTDTWKELH